MIHPIATDSLHPNDYNPNAMTPDEFAELAAEVRHLGRLPKPVVVRQNCAGYIIVDGEHGWRAARDVGLPEVACEVIEADEFESMRQTYKRNQHGTHDPVRLGQMLERMMRERNLSQRELAKDIEVSEGTIRNALEYAKAAAVRNDYAFGKLGIKQIRYYNRLPRAIGDLWLDSGADLKALLGVKDDKQLTDLTWDGANPESVGEYYTRLEETGLDAYLPKARSGDGFREAVKKLEAWTHFEQRWMVGGLSREAIRPYTQHFFRGNWFVREQEFISSDLDKLIDPKTKPPTFRLAPEEFEQVLHEARLLDGNRAGFSDRLRLAILKKTGVAGEYVNVKDELMLAEMSAGAPDYILNSPLRSVEQKYALWKAEAPEWAKQQLARESFIPKGDDKYWSAAVKANLDRVVRRHEYKQKFDGMSVLELAREIATRLPLYDKQQDVAAIEDLARKLCRLDKRELMIVNEWTAGVEHWQHTAELIAAMTNARNAEHAA